MNKIAKISILLSALFSPQLSNAALPTGTFFGIVEFYKGLSLTCSATISINNDSTAATIELTGGICPWLVFSGSPVISPPYPISFIEGPVGSGTFTIHNVEIDTYPYGGCQGEITGTWEEASLEIETILPPKVAGTGDCHLNGYATKIN